MTQKFKQHNETKEERMRQQSFNALQQGMATPKFMFRDLKIPCPSCKKTMVIPSSKILTTGEKSVECDCCKNTVNILVE